LGWPGRGNGGRGNGGFQANVGFQQPPSAVGFNNGPHPFVVDPGINNWQHPTGGPGGVVGNPQHPTGGPGPVPNGGIVYPQGGPNTSSSFGPFNPTGNQQGGSGGTKDGSGGKQNMNQHGIPWNARGMHNGGGNQTPGTRPPDNGGRPIVNGPQTPQGSWGGTPPTPPALPQVQVNANGILELPYNQQFAQDQLGYVQDANNQLLGLNQAAGQQGMQFAQGQRDITQQYGAQQNQTLNQNAVGGTAFSSAYGTQTNNNAKAYANQMGDLQSQNTAFQLQQAAERAAIQSMLNMQLQQAAQGYGNDLNEQAGLLGYGQAPIAPVNVNPLGQHGPPPNRRNRRKKKKGRR
jgi:hypothetical protein